MNKTGLIFLNIYIYTFYIVYSAVFISVITVAFALVTFFMPVRLRMKVWRLAVGWYGRGVLMLPYPAIKVRYEDHTKTDEEKPYIVICNHRSASDAYLMSLLPLEGMLVVNVWPFNIPVIGLYARIVGFLNINRMTPEAFSARASELLREKVSVIFFPEGTRSASRKMGQFHGSAFRLALKTKAPIVPICISGNEKTPPKGSLLMRPGTVRVRRLPAISWDEYKDMNVFTLKNRVRDIIGDELLLMEGAV